MTTKAWAFDSPATYSAADFRQEVIGAGFAHAGSHLTPAQGVLSGLAATGIGTALTWTLGSGIGLIAGANVDGDGAAVFRFDTTVVTHAARDATYSRIDLVGISIVWTTGALSVVVTKGTPSATPVQPASPAGPYLPLYAVTVPAGTGALTVQDVRPRATGFGSPAVCTSSTRPTSPWVLYPGYQIYEADTHRVGVWNGSGAWTYSGGRTFTSGLVAPGAGLQVVDQRAVVSGGIVAMTLRIKNVTGSRLIYTQSFWMGPVTGFQIGLPRPAFNRVIGSWATEGWEGGICTIEDDSVLYLKVPGDGKIIIPSDQTMTLSVTWPTA